MIVREMICTLFPEGLLIDLHDSVLFLASSGSGNTP